VAPLTPSRIPSTLGPFPMRAGRAMSLRLAWLRALVLTTSQMRKVGALYEF